MDIKEFSLEEINERLLKLGYKEANQKEVNELNNNLKFIGDKAEGKINKGRENGDTFATPIITGIGTGLEIRDTWECFDEMHNHTDFEKYCERWPDILKLGLYNIDGDVEDL